ncbi:tripartite tricarboxylate transporter TctB family protein [Streptomonospora litoralis]|uniref:Tripartite tricarboxylate transporter TctB family protein n=1 Tax=Streptomonospora litoralis TaxID=2498135 RepID=A0A4P6Q687_9ACTN|nr:tripartite tricarboxylate transporter TctB family protein [Streptomonospora litoralis]QBI56278.1 Tripartite tricarboxylate transporter TctB family protein [Streptomonospora litoralis]
MAKTPTSRVRLPFQRASAEREPGGAGHAGDGRREPGGHEPATGGAGTPGTGAGAAAGRRRSPVSGQSAFYLVLGALLLGYTVMAFGMEWQTMAGRVGPGLFPRIIGVLGVAAVGLCVVQSLRADRRAAADRAQAAAEAGPPEADTAEREAGSASPSATQTASADDQATGADETRRHPWAVLALCAILAVFVTVMVPVGAVVTGSVALIASLLVCDRSHPVRSVLIGAAFPVALYAVFVFLLNAQLPPGILPLY